MRFWNFGEHVISLAFSHNKYYVSTMYVEGNWRGGERIVNTFYQIITSLDLVYDRDDLI